MRPEKFLTACKQGTAFITEWRGNSTLRRNCERAFAGIEKWRAECRMLHPMVSMIRTALVAYTLLDIGDAFLMAQTNFPFKLKLRDRQAHIPLASGPVRIHGTSHVPNRYGTLTMQSETLCGILPGGKAEIVQAQSVSCITCQKLACFRGTIDSR